MQAQGPLGSRRAPEVYPGRGRVPGPQPREPIKRHCLLTDKAPTVHRSGGPTRAKDKSSLPARSFPPAGETLNGLCTQAALFMTSGRRWRWDRGSRDEQEPEARSEGQESLKPQLQPRAASPDLREPQLPCPSSRNHTVLTPTSQGPCRVIASEACGMQPDLGPRTHPQQEGSSGKTTRMNLKDQLPGERRQATCGREVSGIGTPRDRNPTGGCQGWGAVPSGVMTRSWNQIEGWEHSAGNGPNAARRPAGRGSFYGI